MLPIREVTYAKCYLYEMLPRQSVLYEMLLYENVLYETLLIPSCHHHVVGILVAPTHVT